MFQRSLMTLIEYTLYLKTYTILVKKIISNKKTIIWSYFNYYEEADEQ